MAPLLRQEMVDRWAIHLIFARADATGGLVQGDVEPVFRPDSFAIDRDFVMLRINFAAQFANRSPIHGYPPGKNQLFASPPRCHPGVRKEFLQAKHHLKSETRSPKSEIRKKFRNPNL